MKSMKKKITFGCLACVQDYRCYKFWTTTSVSEHKCLVMNDYCIGINRFHAKCHQNSRTYATHSCRLMCWWMDHHATLIFNRLVVNRLLDCAMRLKLVRCVCVCVRLKNQLSETNGWRRTSEHFHRSLNNSRFHSHIHQLECNV